MEAARPAPNRPRRAPPSLAPADRLQRAHRRSCSGSAATRSATGSARASRSARTPRPRPTRTTSRSSWASSFAVLGWLAGLGFLNYPLSRMMGRPPALREQEEEGPGRYFRLCTDHKVVGIQYFVTVLFFFLIAGLNAMFIRAELITPNESLWNAGPVPHARRPARHDDADDDVGGHPRAVRQLLRADHDRRAADGLPAPRGALVLARAAGGADPAVGDRLRRLPDRLDRLRAAERTRRAAAWTPTSSRSR